jgi:uncharacterized protein (DUF305 family)
VKRFLSPAVIAALLALAACTSGREAGPPGTAAAAGHDHDAAQAQGQAQAHDHAQAQAQAHEHAPAQEHAHGSALPATDGPGYTAADVRFMQAMIAHHAQALTMSEMAPTHGAGEHVMMLAERIDISQRDEIDMMRRWLIERNQAVPDDDHMHSMHMPGMVTEEQLAQLDAARGPAFDLLFLRFMIQHHEGAIHMVDELFASPGAAQDSEIFRFVTDVAADQADEIGAMAYILSLLEATPRSETR